MRPTCLSHMYLNSESIMKEFFFVGSVPVRNHNLAFPVCIETLSFLLFYSLMIDHLLKPVDMCLIMNEVGIFLKRRILGVHRRNITATMYDSWGGEGIAVAIPWWSARESGALIGLRTITLNGLLGNASIMPVTTVHGWVLSHSRSASICTSLFATIETYELLSDLCGSFVCIVTHTRLGVYSSFVIITYFVWSS